MDSAAVGNHNKVKVMATQLLAKFEENAPAQPTGLKRQVWRKSCGSFCGITAGGGGKSFPPGERCSDFVGVQITFCTLIVVCFSLQ